MDVMRLWATAGSRFLTGAVLAVALGASLVQAEPLLNQLVAWAGGGGGTGMAEVQSLAAGGAPTGTVVGREVTVHWDQVELSGGTPAGSYLVRRYALAGGEATVLPGCAGPVTGLTCVEDGVPAGSWRYTVTPRQAPWVGDESPLSATVTVGLASLTFSSSTTITALPATLSGTVAGFVGDDAVTFRLDSPTGPVLSGTPATVGPAGTASITVTIPVGTNDNPHSVFVVGTDGTTASAPITVTDSPTLTALQAFDVDADGKVDRVTATFDETLASYTAGTSPWTLASAPSGATLASVTVSGAVATLNLTEGGGAPATALGSFTVALASNAGGVRDANGHRSSFAATAPLDRAAPAAITAPQVRDVVALNGKVDQVTVSFSETLATYSAGTTPVTVVGAPSGATVSAVSAATTVLTVTLAEGAGTASTAVGSMTMALAASATGVRDAAGNLSSFAATGAADLAAPYPIVREGFDVNGNGKFDRVVVTFSENLAAYSAGTTGWSLGTVPSSGTLASVGVSGATATLSLNEGAGAATTAVSTTFRIGITATASGIRDDAANLTAVTSSATTTFIVDKAAPAAITSPQVRDVVSVNGKVDRVTVSFSETLAAYSAGTTPVTVVGAPSGATVSAVSAATTVLTVTLAEGAGTASTAVGSMTMALAASATGVRDAAGNLSSFAATGAVDLAMPYPIVREGFDVNGNGKFDRVVVTFSENLAAYSAGTTGWSLGTVPSSGTLATVAVSGATATLSLNEGTGAASTAVSTAFRIGITATPTTGIRDAAGNVTAVTAGTTTVIADRAAPVRNVVTLVDNSANGKVDRVTVTWTESVLTTYTAGVTPWTLTGVPSGGTLASVATTTSVTTLTLTEGAGAADTAVGSMTVALAANAGGVRDAAGNGALAFGALAPVDGARAVPMSMGGTNGATDGRIEPGDTLTVTYSEPLATAGVPASTTITLADPSGTGNDTLTIAGLTSGARDTGTNLLVSTDGASAAYNGTMALSADRTTITVTVGSTCTGSGCSALGTATAATNLSFLTAATCTDATGLAPTTTAKTFSQRLF